MIEQADEIFSAEPENIADLLSRPAGTHGSIEAYAAWAGAGPDVVAALRDVLLEGRPDAA